MEAIESHLMAAAKEEEMKVSSNVYGSTLILTAHKLVNSCHDERRSINWVQCT